MDHEKHQIFAKQWPNLMELKRTILEEADQQRNIMAAAAQYYRKEN